MIVCRRSGAGDCRCRRRGPALGLARSTSGPTPDGRTPASADVGAADAPAWRGLAYLVFYDLELRRACGNSLAARRCVSRSSSLRRPRAIAITTTPAPSVSRTMEMAWIENRLALVSKWSHHGVYVERLVATHSTADVAISTTLLPGYSAQDSPHGTRRLSIAGGADRLCGVSSHSSTTGDSRTRMQPWIPRSRHGPAANLLSHGARVERPDDDARSFRARRFSLRSASVGSACGRR